MAVMTPYYHVELNDDGVPIISGTTMKVIELVQELHLEKWTPEELQEQHPYLSMGQVHSAFAYYWDHKDDLDRDIQRRNDLVEEYRKSMPEPPVIQRLRTLRGQ